MRIPHPIPYQGSKRQLAPAILNFLPTDTVRLIEPFAGSAALSLAAAQHGKAKQFVLNDLNTPLIRLWDAIIHRPNWIAELYDQLWRMQIGRERRFYDLVRTRFNRTHQPYYLLYLLARCVKAAVRYNHQGEFNQSPDNRRRGKQPHAMRIEIEGASALLRDRTQVFMYDYKRILAMAGETDVVYLDPPYQGVCAQRDSRYIKPIVFDELVGELQCLNERGISFILSYDGATGAKKFGRDLPVSLRLQQLCLNAGRSTQSTLLGRSEITVESIYLSLALRDRLERNEPVKSSMQLALF